MTKLTQLKYLFPHKNPDPTKTLIAQLRRLEITHTLSTLAIPIQRRNHIRYRLPDRGGPCLERKRLIPQVVKQTSSLRMGSQQLAVAKTESLALKGRPLCGG